MKASRPEVASGAPAPVAAAGAASSSSLAVDADGPGLPDPARRACPLNADCIEIVVEYAASVRDALPLRLVAGRWRGAVDSVVVQLNGRQRRAVGLAAPQDAAGGAPSAGLQRHWRADRGDVLLRVAATGCGLEAVEHVTGYAAHSTMLSSAQCAYAVAVRCPNLRRLVFTGEVRGPVGDPAASPLLPVQIEHLMQRCPLLSDLTGVAANGKASMVALLEGALRHNLKLEHLDVSLVAPSTTVTRPKEWYSALLKDVIHVNTYTLRQASVRRDVVRTPLARYRKVVACIARCASLDTLRLGRWEPEDAVPALIAPVLDDDGEDIGSCASRLACLEVTFDNAQPVLIDPLAELLQHCTSLTTLRLVWTGYGVPVGAPEIAALEPVRRAIRQLPCLTNIDAPGFPLLGAGLEPVLPSATAVAAAFATEQALPDSVVLTTAFGLDPSIVTRLHLDVTSVTSGILEAVSRFQSLESLGIRKEISISTILSDDDGPPAASIAPLVALRGTLQSLTLGGFDREFTAAEVEGCLARLTELHTLQLDNQPCPSPLLLASSLPKLRVLRASEITLRSESDVADFFRLLPRLEIVDTIIVPGGRAAGNHLNPMAQHRHVKLWTAQNKAGPSVTDFHGRLYRRNAAAMVRPSGVAPQLWVHLLGQVTFTTESYTTSDEREPEPEPEDAAPTAGSAERQQRDALRLGDMRAGLQAAVTPDSMSDNETAGNNVSDID